MIHEGKDDEILFKERKIKLQRKKIYVSKGVGGDVEGEKNILMGEIDFLPGALGFKYGDKEGKVNIPNYDEPFSFVVIGDTSERNPVLRHIVSEIEKISPDIVFHTGDIQYEDMKDRYSSLFSLFSRIFSHSLFFAVPGNHEYEKNGEFEEYFLRFFPYGEFLFDLGGITFFGINTEKFEKKERKINFPAIAFFHRPFFPLTHDRVENTALLKFLKSSNVFLAFSGHDHIYARYKFDGIDFVITGGGGGLLYKCNMERVRRVNAKCISTYNFVFCRRAKEISCFVKNHKSEIIDEFSVSIPK